MKIPDHFCHTEFGFDWCAAKVIRLARVPGRGVSIRIRGTGKRWVDIYVSESGRSVRVFDRHKEMKVSK